MNHRTNTMPTDLPRSSTLRRRHIMSALLAASGAAMIAIALSEDIVAEGSTTGFGYKQILLVAFGLVVGAIGIGSLTSAGRRAIAKLSENEHSLTASEILILATRFGFLTGVAEAAIWIVLRFVFLRDAIAPILWVSHHVLWMAPVVNIVIFVLVGLALSLLTWSWPELVTLRSTVFLYTFLSLLALLRIIPTLHILATVALAGGIAVQTARSAAEKPSRFLGIMYHGAYSLDRSGNAVRQETVSKSPTTRDLAFPSRRAFLLTTGAVMAGLAVAPFAWEKLDEYRTLAILPAARPNRPNVLLVTLDTVRAANTSLHGYARLTTPNLERLAHRGMRFDRAIATAPWTLPSHAGIFTGHWHHQLSADLTRALDDTYPTLAEALSTHGYVTAGFVANLEYCGKHSGLNRGFGHYEDFPVSAGQAILSSALGREISNDSTVREVTGFQEVLSRKHADSLTNSFLDWHARQQRRPYFAFLNYFDAHQPYFPPAPFDDLFGPTKGRGAFRYCSHDAERADMWRLSTAELQVEIDAYDGAIAYIDHSVNRLLAELDQRGDLENTLVIITSDHGEQLGEHGLFGHSNSLYYQTLHVPLLLLFPEHVPAGTRTASYVSLRDLPATVMDLLSLPDSPFPGSSLRRWWQESGDAMPEPLLSQINRTRQPLQAWYPLARGDMTSLVSDGYHYIRCDDGYEELYHIDGDPEEAQNLIAGDQGRVLAARLRATMEEMLHA